jgi:hypothetical protein
MGNILVRDKALEPATRFAVGERRDLQVFLDVEIRCEDGEQRVVVVLDYGRGVEGEKHGWRGRKGAFAVGALVGVS